MDKECFGIKTNANSLIIQKKSKFFSFSFYVDEILQIQEILKDFKKKYSDSSHICYAYILHSPNTEKFSDAGEPNGTAGLPMLEILKKRALTNVLVVIVRYFGGIKLGGAGLFRAYSLSCNDVLNKSDISKLYFYTKFKAVCLIRDLQKVENIINGFEKSKICNKIFLDYEKVSFDVQILQKDREYFDSHLEKNFLQLKFEKNLLV